MPIALRRSPTLPSLRSGATFMEDHKLVARALRNYARGIVHPRTAKWMKYWDAITFLCLVFTASVTPFEICVLEAVPIHELMEPEKQPDLILFCLNRAIDAFFISDVRRATGLSHP